jgi:hypothetical protein
VLGDIQGIELKIAQWSVGRSRNRSKFSGVRWKVALLDLTEGFLV